MHLFSRWPLEEDSLLSDVARGYERAAEFDDRFAALAGLPDRFGAPYPKFLYRKRSLVDDAVTAPEGDPDAQSSSSQ